jgi:hypothetical protein
MFYPLNQHPMNRNVYLSLIIFASACLLSACTPYYIAGDFNARAARHQTIAVVPVEMVFAGNQPKSLTPSDIERLEEGESRAFQISLYNEILRSTRSGKKPLTVDMQSIDRTATLMEQAGVSVRDSWTLDPEDLATLLGVDAIVRSRIQKTRYFSDLASYGIDIGVYLVGILTGLWLDPFLPGQLQRNKQVQQFASVVDGRSGTVLWSMNQTVEADWSLPSQQIIDGINRRMARKFPYRR